LISAFAGSVDPATDAITTAVKNSTTGNFDDIILTIGLAYKRISSICFNFCKEIDTKLSGV
jgi:hypothetical protein